MAKGATRVYLLSKELGVQSKAIVEKCQAEGLDVKNHMAAISAGLAATIREWFSEGEHATAVEITERVNLKKVRTKKKTVKKIKKATKAETKAEAEAEAETVAETASATETETAKAQSEAKEPEEKKAKAKAKAEKTTAPVTKAKIKKIKRVEPKPVVPAGPMMEKPKPAKLSGPRVVRVEKVESEDTRPRKPRPARPARPVRPSKTRYDAPISEPLIPPGTEGFGKLGGKKHGKDKTHGRRKDSDEISTGAKKSKLGGKRVLARDMEDRQARLAAARGETLRSKPSRRIESRHKLETIPVERPEKATISEPITVKNLSAALAAKSGEIITKLMAQGIMATANQVITADVAELIALELGTELTVERKQSLQALLEAQFLAMDRENLQRRPPVVTMLGHVDHGKTSLLDRIRSTSVADGEAGGITQHIGAHMVEWKGRKVTFLDTPGHEAFTAMRARGANMTDIVVLVVAADDGLMPQTIEAIHHAAAANVSIVVAINKIDLPGVDLNRIYGQLAEHDLAPAEWGGKTDVVKTSALTGEGVEDLIEHLDYIAELKEFEADSKVPASGWVVEAKMTTTQGAVATLLIKEGVLKKGDMILAGNGYGRIRALKNSLGKNITSATSSMAVEIAGLSDAPQAGDKFFCMKDINRAKTIADENKSLARASSLGQRFKVTLDNLFGQIEAGNIKELNLIIKADVQGSVDVLIKYLTELSTDEVKIKVLHAAVGGITEGDVVLADASGAIIIGFNVIADDKVRTIAETHGVDIRLYNIIYRITEDLKAAMLGMLDPEYKEEHLGSVIVREVYKVSNAGTIAGCYVDSGAVTKKAKVRLIRNSIVIKDNCSIESLRHFKDDIKEAKAGHECGIRITGFDDIKADDVFEAYRVVEVARTL